MAKSARRKSSNEATSSSCADRRPIRQVHQQPYISSTPHLESNNNGGPVVCHPDSSDHMAYWSDYGRLPRSRSAERHQRVVQRYEPPAQRYRLPIRLYDPPSIVNPKMIMGPPEIQKTTFAGQYDTAPSASERAVQSNSSTSKAATTIPPKPHVGSQTVNLQDELMLGEEETWEAPSFFEEAYEAIMLARAAIDSVEEDLRKHEEEFWSYSEY